MRIKHGHVSRLCKRLTQRQDLALQHAPGPQARERRQVVRRQQQVAAARLPHEQARHARALARRAVR